MKTTDLKNQMSGAQNFESDWTTIDVVTAENDNSLIIPISIESPERYPKFRMVFACQDLDGNIDRVFNSGVAAASTTLQVVSLTSKLSMPISGVNDGSNKIYLGKEITTYKDNSDNAVAFTVDFFSKMLSAYRSDNDFNFSWTTALSGTLAVGDYMLNGRLFMIEFEATTENVALLFKTTGANTSSEEGKFSYKVFGIR